MLTTREKYSAGVGMVEVLVALVVIGVGMLGIASLYVTTLQAKTSSQSRMQAVTLANDMADRIRANRLAPSADFVVTQTAAMSAPTPVCTTSATTAPSSTCTADQMAAYDLYLWDQALRATLPGTVTETITAAGSFPTTYTIKISWTEALTGASSLNYTLQVQI